MPVEIVHNGYLISDDPARIDVAAVHRYLAEDSYWATGRPYDIVARSIAHALCLGVYAPDSSQVGFCKIVTDHAVMAHLNDVFILPEHRGKGLGVALVRTALEHPSLATVSVWTLRTRDAASLYEKFGFEAHSDEGSMRRKR